MTKSQEISHQDKIKLDLAKIDPTVRDELCNKYINSFTEDYLKSYTSVEVANDILMLDKLSDKTPHAVAITKGVGDRNNLWQVKLFKYNMPAILSKTLPVVENFGAQLIDEQLRKLKLDNGIAVYICDFGIQIDDIWANKLSDTKICNMLQEALVGVFNDELESDILNKLVIRCGINSQEVNVLRAIAHYIVQVALPFSKESIKECLTEYPNIAYNILQMFINKFDSDNTSLDKTQIIKTQLLDELMTVSNLNDDRILRAGLSVVEAMVRTNYYQLDNNKPKLYLSFKLKSQDLEFLPKPKPLYEIFVYSKRFEGIHLRGGKVARGGIRWSDRKEDFRTEVLGLVKAQIVKNSVIVPSGSKGGFICKALPPISQRDAYFSEGVACYKLFISGLLDITDNLIMGKVVPPQNVVRYDEDDPYLVVAADKGTATFSDYANALSVERGFWLGDAFASGGSAGYDHKKIGITARGAWESAKRHFRHLGKDIQNEDFTVVGIGDMAGDVFGNGMLLSRHIKLIAAFNHQHIFLDPNPNLEASYLERERLFKLPRSSWADYDVTKISVGGGIFERTLKSIKLTREIKEWLRVDVVEMSPNDLISALLKSNIDMIYNGGIGTYIKSSLESNEVVKDKTNDALRVNGCEIKARVVVEGGNLGVTQLGRVEFAKNGGFIYTDAIDNSAGVDCSDHEVNIKILFADIMQKTGMQVDERNKILESMTDEVAGLVLNDNYIQTQILSYASKRSVELFNADMNFIDKLERLGHLDRAVEFLPNTHEVMERQRDGKGLTSPELSVLIAYSKIDLNRKILESDLINVNLFDELLLRYFPTTLQENYANFIGNHYLRQEIIANQLANLIVNRMGITFISRFEDELRVGVSQIVRAFWASYKLLDMGNLLLQIEELDNKIDADTQVYMLIRVKKSLERLTRWILRNIRDDELVNNLVTDYGNSIKLLLNNIATILPAKDYPETNELDIWLIESNVPETFAKLITRSNTYPQLLDIAILAKDTGHDVLSVANNFFYAGRILRFDWLRKYLIALPENNKWQALSRSALLVDGYKLYSTLVRKAIGYASSTTDARFVSAWIDNDKESVNQINTMFDELQTYKTLDLAMLSAVVRELTVLFSTN